MRNFLVPAALLLALSSSGMAMAASTAAMPAAKPAATAAMAAPQSITNTIKAFDLHAHTLTLANGVSYQLPTNFRDPGLKVGQKVTVKWQMNGTKHDAQTVTIG